MKWEQLLTAIARNINEIENQVKKTIRIWYVCQPGCIAGVLITSMLNSVMLREVDSPTPTPRVPISTLTIPLQ